MKLPGQLGSAFISLSLLLLSADFGVAMAAAAREGIVSNPQVAKSPKAKPTEELVAADTTSEYSKILERMQQLTATGQRSALVEPGFFQSLNWIGRTACINYVCGTQTLDHCRKVLEMGLSDDALVVRDHALRIAISTQHFSEDEKRAAAQNAVTDNRNYRKGRPFWIVDRARGFLSAGPGNSTSR
ncbi:MAG: hypothetical protein ACO3A4_05330 [Silvanigrellaceae bacterium]